jgi:hypothetical protein
MSRARLIILSIVAVLAMSAVAAAAASADEWEVQTVEGGAYAKITGAEDFNLEASGGAFTLKAGTLEVKCLKVTSAAELELTGKGEAESISFKECTTNNAECKLKSRGTAKVGEVVVNDIETQLKKGKTTLGAEKLIDTFKENATSKEFVTLEVGKKQKAGTFKMEEVCGLFPATSKVLGNVSAFVTNIAEVAGTHPAETELEFPNPEITTPANTLEAFGKAATLFGSTTQKLIPGIGFGHKAV